MNVVLLEPFPFCILIASHTCLKNSHEAGDSTSVSDSFSHSGERPTHVIRIWFRLWSCFGALVICLLIYIRHFRSCSQFAEHKVDDWLGLIERNSCEGDSWSRAVSSELVSLNKGVSKRIDFRHGKILLFLFATTVNNYREPRKPQSARTL